MKVSKLPIDTGLGGWNAVLDVPAPARILEQNIHTNWLIIGAGFAGLAAARRLRQLKPDDKIVLIDACRVGEGPAGRNSGFMIDLPHDLSSDGYAGTVQTDNDEILLNRTAINYARQAAQEAGLDRAVFNECGKVNVAASSKGLRHLQDYQKHLAALNESCDWLDNRQMRELCGSQYYQAGLFTPGTVLIQPAAYVRGIAEYLAGSINLYENTPAIAVKSSTSHHVVDTPKANITTDKIILAVNGHVQSFGYFNHRLMHVFTYASMTRRLTDKEITSLEGEAQWNFIPADPMGSTVRRISGKYFGGDRIVIRNRFTYDPSMQIDQNRLQTIARYHHRSFVARFPMLGDIDMEFCWGGRLCLSKNNVPAFGEVDQGIFSAACQNGLGTTKGTLSGMLAAELAAGCKSNLLDFYTRLNKPKRLPPEPFMSMGARSVLRFKQWQAGKEL